MKLFLIAHFADFAEAQFSGHEDFHLPWEKDNPEDVIVMSTGSSWLWLGQKVRFYQARMVKQNYTFG